LGESLELSAANTEEIIEAQLAAYLRSRLILSAGSIIAILLIGELMMTQMVVSRLKQFLGAVKRLRSGDLDARVTVGSYDGIAELANALNRVAAGLKEKKRLEQRARERTEELQVQAEKLQAQAEELSALNALAVTVSQSLDLREVLHSALDEVLELMRLRAGWITLRDDHSGELRLAASRGFPEEIALAHAQCNWNRRVCSGVFDSGQPRVFHRVPLHPCPAARYLQEEGLVFRACVPLKSKDLVLGVMSLAGIPSDNGRMLTEDSSAMLTVIGRQIGIAIENASLYEELRQEEMLRRQLIERGITLQEEERKRIARELHDQTGQRLTSMIMTLGVLEEAVSTPVARAYIQDLRDATAQILKEVRDLALELRPSVLDDLGLLAALRHYLKGYQNRFRLLVDFQVLGLDDKRLPPEVETALFRIAQEALTNVGSHAQTHSVTVLLENRADSIMLIVEDDGKGLDVIQLMGSRPHERNLGLYGMRERASLLGGTLTIESTPAGGTTVFVRIPLEGKR